MALEWRLRHVMAEKNIWSGAELGRLLEEKAGYSISPPSISALLNNEPRVVKAETMDALCTALECSPGDLWKHKPSYINKLKTKAEIQMAQVSNGSKLPPI
ncbi:helix-turn-helix domain-containing protein [Cellulosilyticum sp. WCF-2]|uniref:helix-turn-helix domain-containing protein n=1 Tax=Cellulosilyticum sp. WCF-2 TaxID=2497860 RepID=UPI000F8C3E02|nr:helix-turn-helix transcriptional regulator [Cellulosilyticum sp. WCF-2]QEH69196.1 helix-turn-helix transcriptional regulator [Cellulosilyticum sp. WCF-2]